MLLAACGGKDRPRAVEPLDAGAPDAAVAPVCTPVPVDGCWTARGPFGGRVSALTATTAPGVAYAYAGALYRTEDGGDSWQHAGLPGETVAALTVDRTHALKVYVGTPRGLLRSPDGGRTWLAPAGPAGVTHLAVAGPFDAYLVTAGAVHRSTDGGETWAAAPFELGATTLAVTHEPSPRVLVGTSRWIHASADGGATWSELGHDTDDPFGPSGPIVQIVPARAPSGTIYAWRTYALLRSVDGGRTFGRLAALPASGWTSLAVDPSSAARVWIGAATRANGRTLYRSDDGGRTWATLWPFDAGVVALAPWPDVPGGLLAAVDPTGAAIPFPLAEGGGILRSADAGGMWVRASCGMLGRPVMRLAAAGAVLAALEGGLFRGEGASWSEVLPTAAPIGALAAGPSGVLLVAAGGAVWRSPDGSTWTAAQGLALHDVRDLAIDARAAYAAGEGGVFESDDGGATFRTTGAPEGASRLALAPGGALYALGGGLHRYAEGGWTTLRTDSPAALAIAAGGAITVVHADGLTERSADGGATWSPSGMAPPDVAHLQADPLDGAALWALAGQRLHRSADGARPGRGSTRGARSRCTRSRSTPQANRCWRPAKAS